eukprot:NODE_563_length_5987_cov_2.002717.p3 type:complete len:201 gc:universal NODE_563_length_5987_cov_2.002717:1407-805(-)
MKMLKEIESFCQYLDTQYILIDGETRPDTRQQLVDSFQRNPDIPIALLSIKAANTGLTMTKASHVVFGEIAWSFSDMEQAEDRCHRIGQDGQVESIVLIAKGTIDTQLWKLLNKKQNIVTQSLDGVKSRVDAEFAGAYMKEIKDPSRIALEDKNQTTLDLFTTKIPSKRTAEEATNISSDDWDNFSVDSAEIKRIMNRSQ